MDGEGVLAAIVVTSDPATATKDEDKDNAVICVELPFSFFLGESDGSRDMLPFVRIPDDLGTESDDGGNDGDLDGCGDEDFLMVFPSFSL